MLGGAVDPARETRALLHQASQIHIGAHQRRLVREALGLGQQRAVLGDHRVSVPGQVGGRLALAGGRVDVGREQLGRLSRRQPPAVVVLGDGDVRGREVEQHGGPVEGGVGRGRDRRPEVLADLGVQRALLAAAGAEDQVVAEGHLAAEQLDRGEVRVARAGEMALLVELAVVRQVGLGDHAERRAAREQHGAVEEPAVEAQRGPDHQDRRARRARRRQPRQPGQHRGLECLLLQQVVDRVAAEGQLGEAHHRRAFGGAALVELLDALGIGRRIGQGHRRHGRRDPQEAVRVEVEEARALGARRAREAPQVAPLELRQRARQQVVEARAAAPLDAHQPRVDQHPEVLHHPVAADARLLGQLRGRTRPRPQGVEQPPALRIRQGLPERIERSVLDHRVTIRSHIVETVQGSGPFWPFGRL